MPSGVPAEDAGEDEGEGKGEGEGGMMALSAASPSDLSAYSGDGTRRRWVRSPITAPQR
jgi:hypothetical protein